MPLAIIALGGNVGDVPLTFRRAVQLISSEIADGAVRVSSNYRSTPVGAVAGETFWNAAVSVETELSAPSVLAWLHTIESALGRTRELHWGPRTLDLDLILYGSEVVQLPHLIVPHPHAWYRRFVLDPVCDLDRHLVHPQLDVTVDTLRERLLERPLPVVCAGQLAPSESQMAELQREFPAVLLTRTMATVDLASSNGLGVLFEASQASASSDDLPRFWIRTSTEDSVPFLRDVLRAAVGDIWRADEA